MGGAVSDDPEGPEFVAPTPPHSPKSSRLRRHTARRLCIDTHGFRRVDTGKRPQAPRRAEAPKRLTFEHEVFRPSDPQALQHIKRRLKGPSRSATASSSRADGDYDQEELEHAALLQEEMATLEVQLETMIRTHTQKQQFDLQRLDSIWRLAQARLLHQSPWARRGCQRWSELRPGARRYRTNSRSHGKPPGCAVGHAARRAARELTGAGQCRQRNSSSQQPPGA